MIKQNQRLNPSYTYREKFPDYLLALRTNTQPQPVEEKKQITQPTECTIIFSKEKVEPVQPKMSQLSLLFKKKKEVGEETKSTVQSKLDSQMTLPKSPNRTGKQY